MPLPCERGRSHLERLGDDLDERRFEILGGRRDFPHGGGPGRGHRRRHHCRGQPIVDGYQSWSGFWLNEDKLQQNWGILAYIESTNATASVVTNMKGDWSTLMNDLFGQTDSYNSAMHSYDYYWGADEVKMNYAMELLWA
jgi:hypothetical protein